MVKEKQTSGNTVTWDWKPDSKKKSLFYAVSK